MRTEMQIVIDANIVMSALISGEGKTHSLILNDRLDLLKIAGI